jgi:hypothetical protein
MEPGSLLEELNDAFHAELDAGQQSALISWLAFTSTFAAVRGITYAIRAGKGPFRNLSVGGEHLHHYLWGIGLLAGVGGVAVHGEEKQRRHPLAAITYGSGLALCSPMAPGTSSWTFAMWNSLIPPGWAPWSAASSGCASRTDRSRWSLPRARSSRSSG